MARQEKTTEEIKQIEEWLKSNKVKVYPPMERSHPDDIIKVYKGRGRKKKKAD